MIQLAFPDIDVTAKEPPKDVIPSVFFEQKPLIEAIITLYGPIQADVTYSTGQFWKGIEQPPLKSDLMPQVEGVIQADFTDLPYYSRSISSMIIDPPFLVDRGIESGTNVNSGDMRGRFTAYDKLSDMIASYQAALYEAHRVLRGGGILAFKCQDIVSRQKQVMTHCLVWQMAVNVGFMVEDMFLLVAAHRIHGRWDNQRHSRKFHSYVFVFRKRKGDYANNLSAM